MLAGKTAFVPLATNVPDIPNASAVAIRKTVHRESHVSERKGDGEYYHTYEFLHLRVLLQFEARVLFRLRLFVARVKYVPDLYERDFWKTH